MGMSLVSAEGFHLETCRNTAKDIAIISYTECNASSQPPWGQPLEPVSEKSSGPSSLLHLGLMVDTSAFMPLAVPNSSNLSPVFSTTSLLLMPKNKMEVFEKLPQNPHFRKAWNCPPELRGGRAIGLMVSFADMAESIKNMRIQDEPRLYEEKMSCGASRTAGAAGLGTSVAPRSACRSRPRACRIWPPKVAKFRK